MFKALLTVHKFYKNLKKYFYMHAILFKILDNSIHMKGVAMLG